MPTTGSFERSDDRSVPVRVAVNGPPDAEKAAWVSLGSLCEHAVRRALRDPRRLEIGPAIASTDGHDGLLAVTARAARVEREEEVGIIHVDLGRTWEVRIHLMPRLFRSVNHQS